MRKGFVLRWKNEGERDAFATAYGAVRDRCFSKGALWFGWCETDMELPRPFDPDDPEALDPCWDVARIFSPAAELRAQWRGTKRLILLLTEDESLVNELTQGSGSFELVQTLDAKIGYRVLVGEKPGVPIPNIKPGALIEVAFPCELDYGIPTKQGEMLVAEVQCYLDDEHRLRFVRYCSVKAEKKGQREVEPYATATD